MFFRDLKIKPGVTQEITLVKAHLPVRFGRRDARAAFGEPLSRQLAAAGLGTLTDCIAHETGTGEFYGVELHLGLTDASRAALQSVADMLCHLQAPFGSSIRLSDGGEPLIFGVAEGLEVSLDPSLIPDGATRRSFAQACTEALAPSDIFRGWTKRPDRTVFYFYGSDFDQMKSSLESLFAAEDVFTTADIRRMA